MSENNTYMMVRDKSGEAAALLSPVGSDMFGFIVLPRYIFEGFKVETISEAQWESYKELGALSVVLYQEVIMVTKFADS